MIPAHRFATESSVASDIVYVEGPILTILVLGFVFFFVAMTDNYWFIGAGLFMVLVSALFVFFSWRSLADYPLTYRDGDRPRSETQGTGLYEAWELGPKASVRTTFDVGNAATNAESLTSDVNLGYGCRAARVDWRIYANDELLASGVFREGQKRDLTDVPVRSGQLPIVVKLTATRLDSADCKVDLVWHDPGFEGPGNGRFRFVFPIPETD
jgi:hypothetical protein